MWRYRGGRDGHETLQQFMCFLGRPQRSSEESSEVTEVVLSQTNKVYPGVAAFCLPELLERGPPDVSHLQVRDCSHSVVHIECPP